MSQSFAHSASNHNRAIEMSFRGTMEESTSD